MKRLQLQFLINAALLVSRPDSQTLGRMRCPVFYSP
jgi:hypothetical protein